MTAIFERVPEVDPRAAAAQLGNGSTALDVREDGEWEAGRIPGALHIPMHDLAARQNELPAEAPIIVVCRSGSRSAHVTQMLARAGYRAENLAGGMKAWKHAGLPIEPRDGWVA